MIANKLKGNEKALKDVIKGTVRAGLLIKKEHESMDDSEWQA